ncbi:hypothetical protein CRYUN_Cryun09bG0056200 [Craigia yunnanensis]
MDILRFLVNLMSLLALVLFSGVNGCSLKMAENIDVVRDIPVERMMIEIDSPYCEIRSTHAGINFLKSLWPSKKKYNQDRDHLALILCENGMVWPIANHLAFFFLWLK